MIALRPPERMSALNVLKGTIGEIREAGPASVELRLDCGGIPILAAITRRSREALALSIGTDVYAIVKTVSLDRGSFGRGRLVPGPGPGDPADA